MYALERETGLFDKNEQAHLLNTQGPVTRFHKFDLLCTTHWSIFLMYVFFE
jgi:hypothetical protein